MLSDQPILIVEDEFLIALSLADAVSDLGGKVVGPIASVHEALKILDTRVVAAAILDANLIDRDIAPVAMRLDRTGIPFVIHTATDLPPEVAAIRPDLPVLRKPAPPSAVVHRLLAEMRKI